GEQTASLLLAALESRAHRVERAGERAQRPRASCLHTHAVVAALDALRRVDEVAERRRESTDALAAHVEHDHEEEEPGDHEHDRMRAAPRRWAEEVDEHRDKDRDEEREEEEREERKERDAPHESRSHARPVARRERLVRRPP